MAASCSNSLLFSATTTTNLHITDPKVFVILPRPRKTLFLTQLRRIPQGTKKCKQMTSIKCSKDDRPRFDPSKIDPPPYHVYMDSTSGQLEPASGARPSIPSRDFWPDGTMERVRSAQAPAPTGESKGTPSYGKNPGSRRKGYKGNASSFENVETGGDVNARESEAQSVTEELDDVPESSTDPSDTYVVYQPELEQKYASEFDRDKAIGRPHPYFDPAKARDVGPPRDPEDLWWNWRRVGNERVSRWQRRRYDVDTVFAKAMAETGQIKIFGDEPTVAEASLARARKHVFKEERLKAERMRLEEIGPMAYYSEWVEAWQHVDTSREAIKKHYEDTGEDENTQLIKMFEHQTAEEYRIMVGTDIRVKRDPLAMRMREDLIKQIWGGDPVYPTVNYVQEPDTVVDYRGPNFHEPTNPLLSILMEEGKIISRAELEEILAKEKGEKLEELPTDMDQAMATAVDIGEKDDEEDSKLMTDEAEEKESEAEVEEKESEDEVEEKEKLTRNWSVKKTTPQPQKSKETPKKEGSMTLEDAIDDSENLTDFLMDFGEEEEE